MQQTTGADLAQHLETLKRALSGKVADLDEQDLKDELAKYLEYGVPADQAVRTILRHHGVVSASAPRATGPPPTQERITLANLPESSPFVNLKVRILSISTKPVTARGEQKEIVFGLLGDETGTCSYTSWRPLEGVEKGDVVAIEGAYTKAYNGQPQVNFGDRTKLTKLDASELPTAQVTFTDTPIAQLRDGLRGLRVTGRILDVAPRQVNVQGTPKTVWGGSLADASGKIEFSSWSDHNLAAGQAITIEGGYIRSYRGVAQLTFDAEAKVTPATTEIPDVATLDVRLPTMLRDLLLRGGGSDIQVVGTLLEIKDGSGLVMRCSTAGCTRVLVAGQCRIHNKVDAVPDLRIKAVLDDGTGAVSVIAGREITEALLGKDLEACKREAQQAFRPELIQDQLREKLASRVVSVRGNALSDEYGMTFIARQVKFHTEPTAAAATALLEKLGGA